jgi:hypothetical protein
VSSPMTLSMSGSEAESIYGMQKKLNWPRMYKQMGGGGGGGGGGF